MRIVLIAVWMGALSLLSVAQSAVSDSQTREHVAQSLSASKRPKGSARIISAQGNSKENLFVIDPAFRDETQRQQFLSSQNFNELSRIGFIAIVMKDGENNYWLSRVCPDHLGPLEQLLKDGVEVKQSGPPLGFSLLVTCGGLQIDKVVPESAAAKANLQSGDLLVSANGQKLSTRPELADLLSTQGKAASVSLGVLRSGQPLTVNLSLTDAADFKPSSPWPDAYSRRNYQLGITLSQFRTLPFLDQHEWPNAYPVCTDDARSLSYPFSGELGVPPDWKDAGVIECKFFYNSKVLDAALSAGLMLGDIPSSTRFFFISEKGGQEPRLFLIKSGGPSDSYRQLVETFTAGFGRPSKVAQEQYQTKSGSVFQNEIVTWERPSSNIQIRHLGDTTEVLEVTHLLKPLWVVFEDKIREGQAAKAKKL